ncbi:MAG: hypothetical protein ACSHYA_13570 [Opitutaceae bacterium]
MKNEIEEALNKLVGQKMVSSGYAGLQWFLFQDFKPHGKTANYALNVSTAWRIKDKNGIVTGSQDYFHSAEEATEGHAPQENENRVEYALRGFFQNDQNHIVSKISGSNCGSLQVSFEGDYALEILPMDSSDREHWRFFEKGANSPHFVVTGIGVEK